MKYRYRSGEEMKDSGVEWIGKIPKDWEVKKIKHIFELKKDKSKEENPTVLSLTQKGLKIRDISNNEGQLASTYVGYIKIDKDDFILNPMDLISGYVDKSEIEGVISPAYTTFRNKRGLKINHDFYKRYFQMHYHHKFLFPWGEGVSFEHRWTLKNETFLNLPIISNSINEQEKIADFLDEKTSNFDNIISKKEKLIEKLEEAKKSLISEVVTGKVKVVKNGDDFDIVKRDDSEMKDSGVEWIGKIPKDWEVKRIKYLMEECKGRSESGKEEPLSMSQKHGLIKTSEMDNIPNQALSLIGNKLVDIDDLVFNKLKPHLGVFSVSKYKGIVSPDYAVYRAKERVDIKYLEYLFRTPLYINEFKKHSTGVGAGLTRLYTDQLFNIYGITPDYEEQKKIKIVINKKINDIDKTVEKMRLQIEKLKEAKQALISEAVTGKIEILD